MVSSGFVIIIRSAFGERGGDLLHDRADDLGIGIDKILAGHAWLAGNAGRHNDDVRALGFGEIRSTDRVDRVVGNRAGLDQVEYLACCQPSTISIKTTVDSRPGPSPSAQSSNLQSLPQ